jgi:hypothetical protein
VADHRRTGKALEPMPEVIRAQADVLRDFLYRSDPVVVPSHVGLRPLQVPVGAGLGRHAACGGGEVEQSPEHGGGAVRERCALNRRSVGPCSRQRHDLVPEGCVPDRGDHDARFELVRSGRFDLTGLNTHSFAPEDCEQADRIVNERRGETLGVLFNWS